MLTMYDIITLEIKAEGRPAYFIRSLSRIFRCFTGDSGGAHSWSWYFEITRPLTPPYHRCYLLSTRPGGRSALLLIHANGNIEFAGAYYQRSARLGIRDFFEHKPMVSVAAVSLEPILFPDRGAHLRQVRGVWFLGKVPFALPGNVAVRAMGEPFPYWSARLHRWVVPKKFRALVAVAQREWHDRKLAISRRSNANAAARKRLTQLTAGTRKKIIYQDLYRFTNVTERQRFMAKVGMGVLLDKLGATCLETVPAAALGMPPNVTGSYSLWGLSIPSRNIDVPWQATRWLSMINPSTGEQHFEAVPPECVFVSQALAWRNSGSLNATFNPPTSLT